MKLKSLLIVVLTTLILAACSPSNTPQNASTNTEKNQPKQVEIVETSAYPRYFVDGRGVKVTIEKKPTRIVSTTLAVDEYLTDLVDLEHILAVTAISTDPTISNVAGKIDSIETKFQTVTTEQVLALNPELVIFPSYVDPSVIEQIDAAGITTYQVRDDSSFNGILETVEIIGAIVGEEERASHIIADFKERQQAIEEQVAQQTTKPRVLYYTEYGSSLTDNTTIGEMIKLAGGINVVTEAGIMGDAYPDYPNISKELLVQLNPDIILTTAYGSAPSEGEPAFVTEWKNDPAFADVTAIKNNAVYILDSANVTTASHYVIEGLEEIYSVLSGE